MNKKALVIKLVVLIIALVLVVAICLAVVFSSNGLIFHFGDTDKVNTGETFTERTFSADEVKKINIDTLSYDVVIDKGSARDVCVTYSGPENDDKAPVISFSDGEIFVSQSAKFSFFNIFSFSSGDRKIEVSVPEKYISEYNVETKSGNISFNADARELSLESVSGDIQAYGNVSSGVDANSTSGNVSFSGSAQSLTVETVSGDIESTCSGAQTASFSSTSGNVRSRGRFDMLSVETVSGDIFAEAGAKSTSCKLDSVSGKSTISLNDVDGYSVKFDTVSGNMKDSYNSGYSTEHSGSYLVGENPTLKITSNSVSGDFSLSEW